MVTWNTQSSWPWLSDLVEWLTHGAPILGNLHIKGYPIFKRPKNIVTSGSLESLATRRIRCSADLTHSFLIGLPWWKNKKSDCWHYPDFVQVNIITPNDDIHTKPQLLYNFWWGNPLWWKPQNLPCSTPVLPRVACSSSVAVLRWVARLLEAKDSV